MPIPEGWSFVQAASVPVVFLTAWYGLVDLAGLQAGESLLIHSAAGGVGMAALQIARHLGVEVFATASPAKAKVLAGLGLDAEHIASSRDLEFEQKFLAVTGGRGVDVVLNSLDARVRGRLARLAPAGRALPGDGQGGHPRRRADRGRAPRCALPRVRRSTTPGRRVRRRCCGRSSRCSSVACSSSCRSRRGMCVVGSEAFRFMREARHVGKIVLTIPRSADPEGTVLITGGTGGLGALVARHLADRARRQASAAGQSPRIRRAGARASWSRSSRELGCEARVVACDVADREQLAAADRLDPAGAPADRGGAHARVCSTTVCSSR